ncbi:chemotaxis protein CheW [Methylotuvimicrobium buryatense]|uniref:Chemotaxis protein CheW n=1 Tax=Methylotuvimicrobium buryatense TaxID=95641 RepID=A0A4P9UMQ2_METBY|nr:chemotaxis protein CheW [Methylotuvimicrobium buryatense]QCW82619.1 chemotaxis protein CheW [Methylotuvimicrobium buryatense]
MEKVADRNKKQAHDVDLEQNQYLTFMIAGDTFAMGILAIKEIIQYGQLTEIPRMPAFIRGVINLRGAVVPVIDLNARFNMPEARVSRRSCIIIVEIHTEEGEKQDIGVMVDAVNEVLEILPADIEPAPSFGANIRSDFIGGMGKIKGRFVIILNIDQVLSLFEIADITSVASMVRKSSETAERMAA